MRALPMVEIGRWEILWRMLVALVRRGGQCMAEVGGGGVYLGWVGGRRADRVQRVWVGMGGLRGGGWLEWVIPKEITWWTTGMPMICEGGGPGGEGPRSKALDLETLIFCPEAAEKVWRAEERAVSEEREKSLMCIWLSSAC